MSNDSKLRLNFFVFMVLLNLTFSTQGLAQKKPFNRIVVFGTSLSDTGNAFILLSDPSAFGFIGCALGTPANVPPYDALDEKSRSISARSKFLPMSDINK